MFSGVFWFNRICFLMKCWGWTFFFVREALCVFKKANLVSISKATTENDRNISTEIVAATFEKEIRSKEVSGKRVWKRFCHFDARKSVYGMEKVNYPENTIIYLNQAYLTAKNIQKIYYCDFFTLGQIVGASNPPEDMSTYVLKKNEVKMIRPKYNRERASSMVCMKLSCSWL